MGKEKETKGGSLALNLTERLQIEAGCNNRWGNPNYRSGFPPRTPSRGRIFSGVRIISEAEARRNAIIEKALTPR